jgi:hypothetical protein
MPKQKKPFLVQKEKQLANLKLSSTGKLLYCSKLPPKLTARATG